MASLDKTSVREEVNRLKAQQTEKIKRINDNANNVIAKRDLKHKQEMDTLKHLNSQKVRKTAENSEGKSKRVIESNNQS